MRRSRRKWWRRGACSSAAQASTSPAESGLEAAANLADAACAALGAVVAADGAHDAVAAR
eukprot:1100483-Pleurochrysis_carterae.AAC.1